MKVRKITLLQLASMDWTIISPTTKTTLVRSGRANVGSTKPLKLLKL